MTDLQAVLEVVPLVLSPAVLLAIAVGLAIGCVVGALPGFNATLGMAVVLPLVFGLEPLTGLVFLLSIYTGGLYGGAVSAVLLNVPGSPAAIATAYAGYPMAQRGEAGRALGLSIGSSVTGGLIGVFLLILLIQPLAQVALALGPLDLFMVAVFGLTVIAALRGRSFIRTLYAGLFGLLLGTIGLSGSGQERGTLGLIELMDGVPIIPAMVGLFAVSEVLAIVTRDRLVDSVRTLASPREVLRGVVESLKYPVNTIRSSLIGVGIGAVPAAGASVASLIAYAQARRASRHKDAFDAGSADGVVASEASDNASEGGSMATAILLGIPGSSATAVLLGAMILMGWQPGPRLLRDHEDVIYGVLVSAVVEELLLLPIGVLFAFACVYIVKVRSGYLAPIILVLCVVGAFSGRGLLFDVWILLLFGGLGFLLRRYDMPVVAVVLGLLLAPIADRELFRSLQLFGAELPLEIFRRPASLLFLLLTLMALLSPLWSAGRRRTRSRVGITTG